MFFSCKAILFNGLFTLAFFVTLWISEIVSANKRNPSGLQVQRIFLEDATLQIFIRSNKTDQLGKGT